MTILNDDWFLAFGETLFSPFFPEQVNPSSYDLKLDNRFIDLQTGKEFSADEIIIKPGMAILASTSEYVRLPDDITGVLYLKSSLARLGLDHALAGYVDPGFEGNLTLELHSHREITLVAGQRIVQISLNLMDHPASVPYSGKYKGQKGPTRAK